MNKISSIVLLLLAVLLVSACSKSKNTSVKLIDTEGVSGLRFVLVNGERINVEFDENGCYSVPLVDVELPYVFKLMHGRKVYPVLVTEGSQQELILSKADCKHTGDNAEEAKYLQNRKFSSFSTQKLKSQSEAINHYQSVVDENLAQLSAYSIPTENKTFFEHKLLGAALSQYGIYLQGINRKGEIVSQENMEFLKSQYKREDLSGEAFESFVERSLLLVYMQNHDLSKQELIKTTEGIIALAQQNLKDQDFISEIWKKYIEKHINATGINGIPDLVNSTKGSISNAGAIKDVEELVSKWSHLHAGQPAPEFTFCSIEGDSVSLSDFRGKYVYIDMWATWCTPCVAEIPFVQELEKEFHGEDIVFVSISTDEDVEKWKKKVLGDQLKGVQLNTGGNPDLSLALNISGIPRFVMIGKKGEMIDVHCTRPSDPKTKELIQKLLEI